ncbi:MAG: hypothetical protein K1Y36_27645 [Blastocatellia bacterium]|nr:hypothetical protein [Blastocatellia bacterium]
METMPSKSVAELKQQLEKVTLEKEDFHRLYVNRTTELCQEQQKMSDLRGQLNDATWWRPIKRVAPKPEELCMLLIEGSRVVVGYWLPRFHRIEKNSHYFNCEYNSADNKFYWFEGWYETIASAGYFDCPIFDKVTHWLPIPARPEGGK